MKLEVGQFVRFKDKRDIEYIRKITSVNDTYPDRLYAGIYIDKEANNSNGVSLKNIIETSFNIIDLIEEGDYVNGLAVARISEDTATGKKYFNLYGYISGFEEKDIEFVVTKEQFKQMSYRVGEKI